MVSPNESVTGPVCLKKQKQKNSETLHKLEFLFGHLSEEQSAELSALINEFFLFV